MSTVDKERHAMREGEAASASAEGRLTMRGREAPIVITPSDLIRLVRQLRSLLRRKRRRK